MTSRARELRAEIDTALDRLSNTARARQDSLRWPKDYGAAEAHVRARRDLDKLLDELTEMAADHE